MLFAGCEGCRYERDLRDTTFKEFKASSLLQKYEWFKNAAAQCDAKLANIKVLSARKKSMVDSYGDTPRKEWAREDRQSLNVWEQEVAGLIGSYNNLAAEYNAAMSKFNYRFTNVGDLPVGTSQPLPREFKPYME